jgi:hypothetical protein
MERKIFTGKIFLKLIFFVQAVLKFGRKRWNWLHRCVSEERLVEGNAKSLLLKSKMQKDFAAAVYLFEAPPLLNFVLGSATSFVGSESGHIQSVKVL